MLRTVRWNIHANEQGPGNRLKYSGSSCQVIMVTITKPGRHAFEIKSAVQLTLACTRRIPGVHEAERLSVQLKPNVRDVCNAAAGLRGHFSTDKETNLDASWMECMLCRESQHGIKIELPSSLCKGFITVGVCKIFRILSLSLSLSLWLGLCALTFICAADVHITRLQRWV